METDEKKKTMYNAILNSSQLLLSFMNDLHDKLLIDRGFFKANTERHNLGNVVSELVTIF